MLMVVFVPCRVRSRSMFVPATKMAFWLFDLYFSSLLPPSWVGTFRPHSAVLDPWSTSLRGKSPVSSASEPSTGTTQVIVASQLRVVPQVVHKSSSLRLRVQRPRNFIDFSNLAFRNKEGKDEGDDDDEEDEKMIHKDAKLRGQSKRSPIY